MTLPRIYFPLIVLALFSTNAFSQCADAVVALDGSGDYTSVQAANRLMIQ